MTKFYRFIISILIISTLFGTVPIFAEEAKEQEVNTLYSEELNILTALGIFDDTENGYEGASDVSRGELAEIIVKFMGRADAYGTVNTTFNDVAEDNEFAPYINIATSLGIMRGYTDKTFKPFGITTFQEAACVLVRMLGYEKSNVDNDYTDIAAQIGVLKGISDDNTKYLTKDTLVKMVYNCLEIAVLKRDNVNGEYYVDNDAAMEHFLNVRKLEGRVTSNGITSIVGESEVSDDEVVIDKEIYNVGNTNAAEFLGFRVEFYYVEDKDSDENVILYISKDEKDKDTVFIQSDEILSVDGNVIEYYPEEQKRSKNIKVSRSADFIYNSRADMTFSLSSLEDFEGNVLLYDYDNDGSYDLLIINSYDTYVVDTIDKHNNTIFDKLTNESLRFRLDDSDYEYTIYNSNKELVGFDAISADSVLSVLESRDGFYVTVYISNEVFSGDVKEYEDDEIQIEENTYKFSKNFLKEVENSNFKAKVPDAGDAVMVYLDINGKIVFVDTNAITVKNYAYLTKIIRYEDDEDILGFRWFDPSGNFSTVKANKKVVFNGKRYQVSELLGKDEFSVVYDIDTFQTKPQLVVYEMLADGTLKSITTAIDKTTDSKYMGFSDDEFTIDCKISNSAFRTGNLNAFDDSKYTISSSTMVFVVPEDPKADEKKYSIRSSSMFQNHTQYSNLTFYDAAENFEVGVVVQVTKAATGGGSGGQIDDGSSMAVIDGFSVALNEDEEARTKVDMYVGGSLTSRFLEDESVSDFEGKFGEKYKGTLMKDLKKGAVIQFATNNRGEINNIRIVFTPYDFEDPEKTNTGYYEKWFGDMRFTTRLYTVCGEVLSKFNSNMIVATVNNSEDRTGDINVAYGSAGFVLYDREEDELYPASSNDLVKGDQIFMHRRFDRTQFIYIIKN